MIKFLTLSDLNEKQQLEINSLVSICNGWEPVRLTFPLTLENFPGAPCGYLLAYDADLLVSALALSMPTRSICESVGFTHPKYRRRGLFEHMINEASAALEVFEEMELVLVKDSRAMAAEKTFQALDCEYWYSEYMMEYQLMPTISGAYQMPETGFKVTYEKTGTKEQGECYLFYGWIDHEPAGSCSISLTSKEAWLFSLEIAEKYRSQGCGGYFVTEILKTLQSLQISQVKLQVNSQNEPALKLYRNLDFQVAEALDYHLW